MEQRCDRAPAAADARDAGRPSGGSSSAAPATSTQAPLPRRGARAQPWVAEGLAEQLFDAGRGHRAGPDALDQAAEAGRCEAPSADLPDEHGHNASALATPIA